MTNAEKMANFLRRRVNGVSNDFRLGKVGCYLRLGGALWQRSLVKSFLTSFGPLEWKA